MNERIADLMRSKGLHKHISEDCQHRMEMLAELIVRECAKIAANPAPGCHSSFDKIILKHFGIE